MTAKRTSEEAGQPAPVPPSAREETPPDSRKQRALTWLTAAVAALHLYLIALSPVSDVRMGAIHFGTFGLLCALYFPLRRSRGGGKKIGALDIVAGSLAVCSVVYLFLMEGNLYDRGVNFILTDWIFATLTVLLALEFTRRAVGWTIPIIIAASLAYALGLGQYLGGVLSFPGLSPEIILYRTYFGPNGLFGFLARISYAFVFMFVLFGAFLSKSGASDFIIDLAKCATGRLRGGPGFVAVLASSLMGSISGSAAANVVSTGSVTIPMMKRAGFHPRFAAGLETAASTGGQMMPPIMGAGAFVMASYTQIPYTHIIAVALLPAILYFLSVAVWIRINVGKHAIRQDHMEIPRLRDVLRQGWFFVIPIAVLIGALVYGYTPDVAALAGIAASVVASWLSPHPMGPKSILEALSEGAENMIPTAVLLVSIGIVVNMLGTTGLGSTFGLMIDQWSNGNILLALVLIALASLVLGMGLPVTASYIILATMAAPALSEMIVHSQLIGSIASGDVPRQTVTLLQSLGISGANALGEPMSRADAAALLANVPAAMSGMLSEQILSAAALTTALLSAHMIIFWLSQDSNVTPPVCIAAYAAAAIARTDPFRTGLAAWRLAKGLYIIPLLFAFTPFLAGDPLVALEIFFWSAIGLYALSGGLAGYLEGPLHWPERLLALAAGVALLWPLGLIGHSAALIVFAVALCLSRYRSRAVSSSLA